MIPNRETIESINKILQLPANGNEQDWALELADKSRILEFIQILDSNQLSEMGKYAIMELILASYDDYLQDKEDGNNFMWETIKGRLDKDCGIYDEMLNYWALLNENDEDIFRVTPLVRSYLKIDIQRAD